MRLFLVSVVGYSGSGKTTLIERLIPLLRKRGLKVGTVKHAHHGFDLDARGKDTWRHLKAGAQAVAAVGLRQVMVVRRLGREAALEQALEALPPGLDMVLLEGFSGLDCLRVAVADAKGRLRSTRGLIAAVSKRPLRVSIRRFSPDQARELAGLLEQEWVRHWEKSYRFQISPGSSSAGD